MGIGKSNKKAVEAFIDSCTVKDFSLVASLIVFPSSNFLYRVLEQWFLELYHILKNCLLSEKIFEKEISFNE